MDKEIFGFEVSRTIAKVLCSSIDFDCLVADDYDGNLNLNSDLNYDRIAALIDVLESLYSHRPLPF